MKDLAHQIHKGKYSGIFLYYWNNFPKFPTSDTPDRRIQILSGLRMKDHDVRMLYHQGAWANSRDWRRYIHAKLTSQICHFIWKSLSQQVYEGHIHEYVKTNDCHLESSLFEVVSKEEVKEKWNLFSSSRSSFLRFSHEPERFRASHSKGKVPLIDVAAARLREIQAFSHDFWSCPLTSILADRHPAPSIFIIITSNYIKTSQILIQSCCEKRCFIAVKVYEGEEEEENDEVRACMTRCHVWKGVRTRGVLYLFMILIHRALCLWKERSRRFVPVVEAPYTPASYIFCMPDSHLLSSNTSFSCRDMSNQWQTYMI